MAENTQIAEKTNDFKQMLTDKLNAVTDCLPVGFNKQRFVQNSLALLNDDAEKYSKYSKQTLISNILRASYLGLDLYAKEAYLVPFGDKLTFMPSYIGNVKLAKKYSIRPIRDIYAKVIREGDEFIEEIRDGVPSISFKPKFLNDGEIIGAFAVVVYTDSGMGYEVMSKAEIENTRKSSKAKSSPAWSNFYSEMAKKTVLKRLCKHIDLDFENLSQQETYNEDMAIETDPMELHEADVTANANSEEFIDMDAETGEVVADGI